MGGAEQTGGMRMRLGRTARLVAAALTGGVLAAAAACSGAGDGTSSGSAPPSRTLTPGQDSGAHPEAAWPTYGRDFARSGVAARAARQGALTVSWRAHLDGAVYGQPLLVGQLVIAATENDSIYALDQATGRVIWRTNVGTPVPLSDLPCGNIDPLGITGTPVYDPATHLVFAVAEITGFSHTLVGVDVNTGKVLVRQPVDAPGMDARAHQQRAALALANGMVYVAYGGLDGDCSDYIGRVVALHTNGQGPLLVYTIPTSREGGIWAPSGPAVDANGNIYVAVGNGASTGGN